MEKQSSRESELGARGPISTGGGEQVKKENEKGRKDTAGDLERGRQENDGERENRVWVTHYRVRGERERKGERFWGAAATGAQESKRTGCSSLLRLPVKNLVTALFSSTRGHGGHAHRLGVTFSHKPFTHAN